MTTARRRLHGLARALTGHGGPTASGPLLLMELAQLLWPDAPHHEVTRISRPQGGGVQEYLVLPGVRSPRWLLPTGAPSTVEALAGQEPSWAKQAAVRLLGFAQRSQLAHRLPYRRLAVTPGRGDSLVTAVRNLVGADVDVAIRLGSWSHARSLVLRAFAPDGTTVAFGKVGIDAHGRAAVRAEGGALARVGQLDLEHIAHSDVLHHGEWRGLALLVVSPLGSTGRPAGGGDMPVRAMLELAHAGGARREAISRSRWLCGSRRRVGVVADPGIRARFESCLVLLGRLDVVLPMGFCHGDWTPWNMAWDRSGVLLWDWEHFAVDAPVGFDLVHYLAQRFRVSSGPSRRAEDEWRVLAADALARHVALTPSQSRTLLVAYLLEVNLRFVLDRQSTPERGRMREGWGLDLLARATEQLAGLTQASDDSLHQYRR